MFIDITMFKTVPSAGAEHRNILHTSCLQCFGTVGWASGRASGRKIWAVRCWRRYRSGARYKCRWSSWYHCDSVISCFIKIYNGLTGLTFLVSAYLGCPGKEAVKRVPSVEICSAVGW